MVLNRAILSYQLIQTMLCHDPIALRVGIDAVILPGSLTVNSHAKANGFAVGAWAEHQVQITRMESKDNLSSSIPSTATCW